MVEIIKVSGDSDIASVARLAREIWNDHFVPIIGQAQVDYMLERFQSAPAIRCQMAGGYEYYLAIDGERPAGYFAVIPRPGERTAQLSKVYLLRELRGRGIGRRLLEFVESYCAERGIEKLWLTVNRHNAGSIAFYERMGFVKEGELVMDIGGGFVMDDYKMVKGLGTHGSGGSQGSQGRC